MTMTDDARPIIGVTGPDRGGGAAWIFTRLAIILAGGRALRITPKHPRHIDCVDGLVIGGGADVAPSLYGQELLHVTGYKKPDESIVEYVLRLVLVPVLWMIRKFAARQAFSSRGDVERDALEVQLIRQATERKLPLLGICRGQQLLNICFGGTLHQSLKGFYVEDPEVRTVLPTKRIVVSAGTRLAEALGSQPPRVNALHQQAINHLGQGLRVAARDRNGIVQAVEHTSLPFVLGVQWHPEYMLQQPQQRAIFGAIVRHAREIKAMRATPADWCADHGQPAPLDLLSPSMHLPVS
jgi:putative glutamine amidotransferase